MATTHSITPDLDTRAGRMFAAGRVTVTFTSPSGEHITITAKSRKPGENGGPWTACPLAEAKIVFFSVPNAGGGWDDKVGKFTYGRGFTPEPGADPARVYCAKQLVVFAEGRTLPNALRAQEEERCGKCGRALTDPVSIDRGIGPECYGQMTGSKHETKGEYGSPGHEAELIALEEREYETEMREGF